MVELEEKYHDPDLMCAVSVIEHETEYLSLMCRKLQGDDLEFFKMKIDSLNFAKDTLETNVSTGVLTIDKYMAGVKKYQG